MEHDELRETLRQVESMLHKLRETVRTLEGKDPQRMKSQITLARRRIRALEISRELMEEKLSQGEE